MNLKLLWYCTKAKDRRDYLYKLLNGYFIGTGNIDGLNCLNGKIVAESDYDCEEIIHTYENNGTTHHHYNTKTLDNEQLLRKSRIFGPAIDDYLGNRQYDKNNNVVGYAIHIKNLEIFDKPKKLSDFYRIVDVGGMSLTDTLKKAPQNMMYVSINEWEYCFYNPEDKRILISVRPEWACKILNGEKTIEVRKQVLNCMKGK